MKTLVVVLFFSLASSAANYKISGGEIRFKIIALPGNLKIEGKSSKVSGEVTVAQNKAAGEISVGLDNFSTGISLRDKHLKEKYLETQTYPNSTLKLENLNDNQFTGELTLHGKTNPVKGTYKKHGTKIISEFKIKNSDFGIQRPSFLNVTVHDDVEVTAEFNLNETP